MPYRLSQDAAEDVDHILETGFAAFGAALAEFYHGELMRAFDLLAVNPRMARLRKGHHRPIRLHPFRAHVIIYTETGGDVLILRILHHRQDWLRHLT